MPVLIAACQNVCSCVSLLRQAHTRGCQGHAKAGAQAAPVSHAATATSDLFSQCLQPLQSFHKAGVLASRFGLPPPQDMLGTAEEDSDGEVAVLGSYAHVKACTLADEGCRRERL